MIENHERRQNVRIDHTSVLRIKDLKSGKVHKARMLNYSKNGLYFETDSVLDQGDKICIAIQDSPFALKSGELEYYNAEILWRRKFEDTFFDFGYGVKFLPSSDKKKSKSNNLPKRENVNKIRTKSHQKNIYFSDRYKTYEGIIKDISPSGVFFASQDTFELGQILSFALPLKNGTEAKIEGQIIWTDEKGLGAIFLNK
jgi:Tfp pilus assembly protein PilZ